MQLAAQLALVLAMAFVVGVGANAQWVWLPLIWLLYIGFVCGLGLLSSAIDVYVRDLRYVEGSYDRHLVKEALGTRDLTFGWGGWAKALPGLGLGIEIDPIALERVRVRQEVLLG